MVYIGIFLYGFLIWMTFRASRNLPLKNHFFPSLVFKSMAGLSVGMLYYFYYGEGDTIVYDHTATIITDHLGDDPGNWISFLISSDLPGITNQVLPILSEPRSRFFIKVLSILYVFTGQSYWVSSLFLSLFSFLGGWYLANVLVRIRKQYAIPAVVAFLYFPSLIFWSSGVLKESIAYPCIMFIMACFLIWLQNRKLSVISLLLGILLFYLLWKIKYHYAAVLFPVIFSSILYVGFFKSIFRKDRPWILVVLIMLTGMFMTVAHPNFNLFSISDIIIENHQKIISISDNSNLIQFIPFEDGQIHFLINLPVSLFGGLFMPLPWQGFNWLIHLTGFLNFLVLVLLITKIMMNPWKPSGHTDLYLPLVMYIGILSILMAYTSPNFGTLERYKISYLPFFIFLVLVDHPLLRIFDRNKKNDPSI